MESRKRAVPALGKLLDLDEITTEKFCRWSQYFYAFRYLKAHSKTLEVSCHGIPWFVGVFLFIVVTSSAALHQQQVNLLFGLILDVVLIAIIKAYVRRRRPHKNRDDMFMTLNIDNFSFPSGHASRSVLVAYFFMFLCPLPSFFVFPLLIWVISVCISRILLNRHYILDVIGGVVLGYMEGVILGLFWLSKELSVFLISWLSDSTYDDVE